MEGETIAIVDSRLGRVLGRHLEWITSPSYFRLFPTRLCPPKQLCAFRIVLPEQSLSRDFTSDPAWPLCVCVCVCVCNTVIPFRVAFHLTGTSASATMTATFATFLPPPRPSRWYCFRRDGKALCENGLWIARLLPRKSLRVLARNQA